MELGIDTLLKIFELFFSYAVNDQGETVWGVVILAIVVIAFGALYVFNGKKFQKRTTDDIQTIKISNLTLKNEAHEKNKRIEELESVLVKKGNEYIQLEKKLTETNEKLETYHEANEDERERCKSEINRLSSLIEKQAATINRLSEEKCKLESDVAGIVKALSAELELTRKRTPQGLVESALLEAEQEEAGDTDD